MSKAPRQTASSPAGAEVIPDVEVGGGNSAPSDAGEINENGLTADEQAEFDRMAAGGDDGQPGDGENTEGDPPDDPADGDPADPDGEVGDVDPADPADPADGTASDGTAAAQPGGKPTPKSVSWGKYQRETTAAKKRAKAAEEARTKLEADNIKLGERLRIINEALQAQAAAPAPAAAADPAAGDPAQQGAPQNPWEEPDIDPTVDYAGAVAQLNRRSRFVYDQQQGLQETSQEQYEDTQIRDTFTRDATRFAATEEGKHFPEAYAELKDKRLCQIGRDVFRKDPRDPNAVWTQQEINQMVAIFNAEEKNMVANAIKHGVSPAAEVMFHAQIMGFRPSAAPDPAAAAAATAAPAARPAAPAAPAAAKKPNATAAQGGVAAQIAELAKARDDGRSLSDGGSVPADGFSVESLLRMSDEEFGDMVDNMAPGKLDALMGK